MTDPRLSEATPSQLAEALLRAKSWNRGGWTIEIVAKDGIAERWFAKQAGGRHSLDQGEGPVAESDAA